MNQTKASFKKYVIPSMISSVVLGTFSIIDGLFIGNKIGDIGLAAINYAYPITALIQSIGFGLGVAGSILMSIAIGKKEDEKRYVGTTYALFLLSFIILMPLLLLTGSNLLILFGASGETHSEALIYLKFIVYATIPQVLSQGLMPIIRNYGHNKLVMIGLILGFVTNLILDYVFIYPLNMGLMGAAIATNLAQVVTTLFCLIILLQKKYRVRPIFDKKIMFNILKLSLSPFGLSFATNIVIIIINKACSIYQGDYAVAAYTAIAYVTYVVQKLIQGVGDGVQPLLSYSKGKGNRKKITTYLKYSLIWSLVIGLISTAVVIILREQLGHIFGISDEAIYYFKDAAIFFSISFIAQAIMRIAMSYFYSQNKEKYSLIIVYGEPVLILIFSLILPLRLSVKGIWLTIPVSYILLAIISVILMIIENKKEKAILEKEN